MRLSLSKSPNETPCFQKHISDYLHHLSTQRKLSPNTIYHYRVDLQQLQQFIHTLNTLNSITPSDIRKWASQLHAQGITPRSIARKLSTCRGFFAWLIEQNALAINPATGVKSPKHVKTLPTTLSTDDAVHLVSTGAHNTATKQCDHAIYELLYSSGLRISELVGLDYLYTQTKTYQSMGWLDMDTQEVIVTGKGNKMRRVPVGAAALQALTAWLSVRSTLLKHDPLPLFLTRRGTRISPRLIQLRIKAHAQKIGLPTNVHPHMLRHSFATHVLQSSGDLRAVQEMLGHASITATQIYTALDFQHLAHIYDATHPRAQKK